MNHLKISVLTPTYNRENKIRNVYNSLLNQKYTNFEWILVDDGSTDNTNKVVNEFIKDNRILIKYIRKENGGKPSAHNRGVEVAESDLILICDDDDYLTDDCLLLIVNYFNKFNNSNIGGCIGYRGISSELKLTEDKFPDETYSNIRTIFKNKIFDTTQIYKTKVLKQNLFPITKGEKFVPEIWLWKKIDKEFNLIVIPHILEICEYQKDGLTMTNSQNLWNNPIGFSYYFFQKAEESSFVNKIKYYGIYLGLTKDENIMLNDIPFLFKFLSWPLSVYVNSRKVKKNV